MTQDKKIGNAITTYGRDQVVSIINSVISKVKEPQAISREVICHELAGLKDVIEDLRHQLNAAQAGSIGETDIPNAKDELDAVVGATEAATTTIMDSCEKILAQMAGEKPDLLQKTEAEICKIYEACTFQDITGQRITKVIKTLKKIDEQVSSLLGTLDTQLISLGSVSVPASAESNSLLNGPALPQNAVSQEEIDKILAAFDN
jgi:chemotaxis protein CheZ